MWWMPLFFAMWLDELIEATTFARDVALAPFEVER